MPKDKSKPRGITVEEYEDRLLSPEQAETSQSDLNNTITGFSNLVVNGYVEVNKKRNRSLDTTPVESPNPIKKYRTIMDILPSMAEAVKANSDGQIVDIVSMDKDKPLTKQHCEDIKGKLTLKLFAKEDISNIKFDPPYFDGEKLRVICKNDETKNWLLETVPLLTDLQDGINIDTTELGASPKMVTVTIIMPVKTYEPLILFQIIAAQNGIDITYWRYRSRTKVSNGKQTWFIGIDETSLTKLKELGFRPYVGMERIRFSVNNGK